MGDEIKDYEEKKAAHENKRKDRIYKNQSRAKKAKIESESRFNAADKTAELIPMGQPILIGHHSEKRHRRALDKIHNNMIKGIELQEKAAEYESRAQAAINNYAISSSDPDAVKLLKEKIADLEAKQAFMKKANLEYKKYLAAKDKSESYKMNFTDSEKEEVLKEAAVIARVQAYYGDVVYPPYALTNNNAKIRQAKVRVDGLQKFAKVESSAKYTPSGLPDFIQVKKDTIENRFKVYMPKKFYLESNLKDWFKQNGWRWSPTNGCHQRMLSTIGWNENRLIDKLKELTKGE